MKRKDEKAPTKFETISPSVSQDGKTDQKDSSVKIPKAINLQDFFKYPLKKPTVFSGSSIV